MKSIIETILILTLSVVNYQLSIAQTVLTINGSQVVQEGHFLVFENAKLINNSIYKTNNGTVVIKGDASTNSTTIGGLSTTHFSKLNINKTTNNVLLESHISVEDTLYLTSGLLELSDYNILISDVGEFSGATQNTYVKTSGTGTIQRKVSSSYVDFPVGDNAYSAISIQNTGTTDTFSIRTESAVYKNGISGAELTEDVVDNSWYISENTVGNSTANIIFQWYASEELTNFDRSNSNVAFYDGTQWIESTNGAASGSDPYLKFFNGTTNLGAFAIVSDGANLPVELLYFYAKKEGQNVRLDWQTATELNNSHFDVEWSRDGISFEKIGEVAGAGTTNEIQFYDFLHLSPILGQNYYRLRQASLDGKLEYTNIIQVTFDIRRQMDISIYPNPASEQITIELHYSITNGQIIVTDTQGKIILQKNINEFTNILNVSNWAKGTYFISVIAENGSETQKIVVF